MRIFVSASSIILDAKKFECMPRELEPGVGSFVLRCLIVERFDKMLRSRESFNKRTGKESWNTMRLAAGAFVGLCTRTPYI